MGEEEVDPSAQTATESPVMTDYSLIKASQLVPGDIVRFSRKLTGEVREVYRKGTLLEIRLVMHDENNSLRDVVWPGEADLSIQQRI